MVVVRLEPTLLVGSIQENIVYGKWRVIEVEIIEVSKVNAHKYLTTINQMNQQHMHILCRARTILIGI